MTEENKSITIDDESDESLPSNREKNSFETAMSLPVREQLVSTAVHFLQNQKVQSSPVTHKVAFLKKKGLTDEEINLALAKASSEEITKTLPSHSSNQLVPVQPQIIASPISVWTQINRIGSSFIIIGITLYGIHRFYKLYVEPWLFGTDKKESRLSLVERQLSEVNQTMSQLMLTQSRLEDTINSQKDQIEKVLCKEVNEYYSTPLALNDLKGEVASIKSLLLNRHQFPAIPKVSPTIPDWQMPTPKSEDELNETENKSVESTEIPEASKVPNGEINSDSKHEPALTVSDHEDSTEVSE